MRKPYFCFLVALVSIFASYSFADASYLEATREGQAEDTLTNRLATPSKFDQAVVLLQRAKLRFAPSFWAEIVNDHSYPAWHRRKCLYQLFLQNGQRCYLAELVSLPKFTHWFKQDDILRETNASDLPIPFKGARGDDEYYALMPRLPKSNRSAIVVRVRGRYEAGNTNSRADSQGKFVRAITGRGSAEGIYIIAVGIDDESR